MPIVLQHVPQTYLEEMKGLAEGSKIALEKIQLLNLFPEMFHCSGIVALPESTANGSLYHTRVLDYRVGQGLEKASVLMVVEPTDAHSFFTCVLCRIYRCHYWHERRKDITWRNRRVG